LQENSAKVFEKIMETNAELMKVGTACEMLRGELEGVKSKIEARDREQSQLVGELEVKLEEMRQSKVDDTFAVQWVIFNAVYSQEEEAKKFELKIAGREVVFVTHDRLKIHAYAALETKLAEREADFSARMKLKNEAYNALEATVDEKIRGFQATVQRNYDDVLKTKVEVCCVCWVCFCVTLFF
jgi:hypothetical protein